jgi:hypothetical protein
VRGEPCGLVNDEDPGNSSMSINHKLVAGTGRQ